MKNVIVLLFSLLFLSCSEDVQTNTPAFQANLDNVFWRAADSNFKPNGNGTYTVTAYTDTEIVTIEIPSLTPGTYTISATSPTSATYTFNSEGVVKFFETENGGSGTVKIENLEGGLTAKFRIVLKDENDTELVFSNGQMYKVPAQ